ncbi:MAG TPA: class I adenylate-forming enzyme family protein [Candidatus Angelobacter sp.]|nr:class I adenylate-forming enzyme family protein [Candidatus Angelobacter sp.]
MTARRGFERMTVPHVIGLHARSLGAKKAIVEDGRATTYAELHAGAIQAAAALQALGVRQGERVGIAMQPSAAYVSILLGAMTCGAVPAPLNTRLAPVELADYLRRLEPRLVLSDGTVGVSAPVLHLDPADPLGALLRSAPGGRAEAVVPWDSPAGPAIAFPTGGTTGLPKAAVWGHTGLALGLISACMHLGVGRADTELYFSPMYHLTLVTSLLAVLYAGGTVRLLQRFEEDAVLRALENGDGVTRFFGTPGVIERLLGARLVAPSLRSVVFGASRSGPDFPHRLQAALPRVGLMTGYGATEFGAVTRVYPGEILDAAGGVGRAVAGVELSVRSRDGGEVLGTGEVGEVAVRSPMAMLGYLSGETVGTVDGDAIRSGDLGALDAQGRLHLHGRISELIKTGGENVFPSEVERVVVEHAAVLDAVVYGVEDATWGERVECAVIPVPGAALDLAELRAFCATRLGGYKVPKRFRVVTEFPRTTTQKLDRQALRRAALLAEQPA